MNEKLEIHAIVPPNTSAMIYLPADALENILESDQVIGMVKDIRYVGNEGDYFIFEVGSGTYQFAMPWKK